MGAADPLGEATQSGSRPQLPSLGLGYSAGPPVPALSDAAHTRGSVSAASVLCPPSAMCASDVLSRSPAVPEHAPEGNSPFALTPTSTASALLPSRGGPENARRLGKVASGPGACAIDG